MRTHFNPADPEALNVTRYLEPLWFEKFDVPRSQEIVASWQRPVVALSICYVLVAFIGREWMRNREPYQLKKPLIVWNGILAVFSIFGFLRTFPTFVVLLSQPEGMYRSVCTFDYSSEPDAFWALMYTLSKLFEFVDTGFIILRKAPLLFLHWYHHMSMAIFTFYLYPISDPVGRWSAILNIGIHSLMYSYYALKMAGFKIPKQVSSLLTKMQMGQFILTFVANVYALVMIGTGQPCILSRTTMVIQFIGSISYLALFANFYYQTYIKRKPKSA